MLRIAVLVCLAVAGCGRKHTIPGIEGVRVGFGGNTGHAKVIGNTTHIEVGAAKYEITVQNGKLTINGRDYGNVTKGDRVIATEREIFINDRAASPRE
jgi:hypothetical protein